MAASKDTPPPLTRANRLVQAAQAARKGGPQTARIVSAKAAETKPAQRAIKYPKGGDALRQHVSEVQNSALAVETAAARLQAANQSAVVAAEEAARRLRFYDPAAADLATSLQNALRIDPGLQERLQEALRAYPNIQERLQNELLTKLPQSNSAAQVFTSPVQNGLQLPAASTAPGIQHPPPAPRQAEESQVPAAVVASPADLGRLVRGTREQRRMTQAQLAAAAGAGRRFISELESGKPTLELGKVLGVCQALGLKLSVTAAPYES